MKSIFKSPYYEERESGGLAQKHGFFYLFLTALLRYLKRVPYQQSTGRHKAIRVRPIAFYLPQFHPIPENDEWWGKGFTEWTNVIKAVPLFRGHHQPRVPGPLGYYSLLDPKVRETQAEMARQAGIEGFCYWHYWFGDGKRLLEKPFQQVLESGNPDFPFCLGWANESWTGIWHDLKDNVLMAQKYPGEEDYRNHFLSLLPAFRDSRYIKVDGKPLFVVYKPWQIPDTLQFSCIWRELATKNGLPGLFLVGISDTPLQGLSGFNGWMSGQPKIPERTAFPTLLEQLIYRITGFHTRMYLRAMKPDGPQVFPYRSYVRHSFNDSLADGEFPVVVPNWDNTPRAGRRGTVLQGTTPALFKALMIKATTLVARKPPEERLIFIKSWNEWAEGNYLEPDNQYGSQYLQVLVELFRS